jgi:hypothetical protein
MLQLGLERTVDLGLIPEFLDGGPFYFRQEVSKMRQSPERDRLTAEVVKTLITRNSIESASECRLGNLSQHQL